MLIKFVKLESTGDWRESYLKELGIKKTFSIYAYNPNEAVHCCEITPSYEMKQIDEIYELADGFKREPADEHDAHSEDLSDADYDQFQIEWQTNEPWSYHHCSGIDKIPDQRDIEIDSDDLDWDQGYGSASIAAIEKAEEEYKCNPYW